MRIESPFHDYYDCIQAHGMDQNLVYVRRPKTMEKNPLILGDDKHLHLSWRDRPRNSLIVTHMTVGFCGKCYPLIRLESHKDIDAEAYCYSLEDVDKFVEENFKKREINSYRNTDKVFRKPNWPSDYRRTNFEKYLQSCEGKGDSHENWFLESNSPIFISHYKGVRWSPEGRCFEGHTEFHACLKKVEFFRIVEPYTAYQELQMYLTGVLGLTDQHKAKYQGKMIELDIDDVTKAESKGYDKWSFRKEPKKK